MAFDFKHLKAEEIYKFMEEHASAKQKKDFKKWKKNLVLLQVLVKVYILQIHLQNFHLLLLSYYPNLLYF